eukprot:jgi/Mesvir1/26681/Mv20462-RA.2
MYSEGQMRDVMHALSNNLYGNPHSLHASGEATGAAVAQLRQSLLALCGVSPSEYACVLTSGATSALRMVAELFPWQPGSSLAYTRDNHTSAVGMRQYALAAGASAMVLDVSIAPQKHSSEKHAIETSFTHGRFTEYTATPCCSCGRNEPGAASADLAASNWGSDPGAGVVASGRDAPAGASPLMAAGAKAGCQLCGRGNNWVIRATPLGASRDRGGSEAVPSCVGGSTGTDAEACGRPGWVGEGQSSPLARWDAPPHSLRNGDPGGAPSLANGNGHQPTGKHSVGHGHARASERPPPSLLVFPTESNFSGKCYGLGLMSAFRGWWREQAQEKAYANGNVDASAPSQIGVHQGQGHGQGGAPEARWFVMLDAAKGFTSRPPDLSKHKADFVALSLYKMCGYPSGLGALLIRRETASDILRTSGYFGGGTVAACLADEDYVMRRALLEDRLENGTVPFLEAVAALQGLAALQRLGGMPPIHRHVSCLARHLATELHALRHGNGRRVCQLYGWEDLVDKQQGAYGDASQPWGEDESDISSDDDEGEEEGHYIGHGSIVTFNLLRGDGSFVGSSEVEQMASLMGIHLRIGCLCNPGACAHYLGLTSEDVRRNYEAGHVCWDRVDLLHAKPTGAVRVSFGYMSAFEDAQAVLDFVRKYFVDEPPPAKVAAVPASVPVPNVGSTTNAPIHEEGHVMLLPPSPRPLPPIREGGNAPAPPLPAVVSKLFVYPIKSCQGFSPTSWPLTPYGLKYDRQWAIVGEDYAVMTLTKHPALCRLKASVDLDTRMLWVESPDMPNILMLPPAHEPEAAAATATTPEEAAEHAPTPGRGMSVAVCGDRVCSIPHAWDSPASAWLSQALGVKCTLVAYPPNAPRAGTKQQAGRKGDEPVAAGDKAVGATEVRGPEDTAKAWEAKGGAANDGGANDGRPQDGVKEGQGSSPGSAALSFRDEASGNQGRGGDVSNQGKGGDEGRGSMQSFANEGPFLLVTSASVRELNHRIRVRQAESFLARGMVGDAVAASLAGAHPLRRHSMCVPTSSRHQDVLMDVAEELFRPNIVVEGPQLQPFEEDTWQVITLEGRDEEGQAATCGFEVLGGCRRCAMICLDTQAGKFRKDQEPLKTLATFRRKQGRILFGVHMALTATACGGQPGDGDKGEHVLRVGSHLGVQTKTES